MSDPNSSEPPPLPPQPEASADALIKVAVLDRLPAMPAPLLWRSLAYIFDWLVAMITVVLVLKWTVPSQHAEGLTDLRNWAQDIWNTYLQQMRNPAPLGQTMQQSKALAEKISAMPETVVELFGFVAMVQTSFFWAFFTITEYLSDGASLGKKIFNIRVANIVDSGPPSFFDTLFRSGWKAIFFCSSSLPLLLIGIIDAHVPLFNVRRRSWHDMLTRTEVIDARLDPWFSSAEDSDEEVF